MSDAHRPARAKPPRAAVTLLAGLALAAAGLAGAAGVFGQDLQSQLDDKQAQLDKANSREGVLSTTIQRAGEQLDQLRGEVATLRNREAIVQAELEKKEAELKQAKDRLAVLRVRLKRSLKVLRERLVAIYESSSPDALTVILNSDGFDQLLSRYEYLQRIQSQDTSIAERVRTLRDKTKDTVERVRAARDEIAAKRAELASTRSQLEAREGNLAVAREQDQRTLAQVQETQQELEGDISDIQAEVQAQLQAAQSSEPALPAGPIQGESSSGFIWPVNGPITSPFCEQRAWESCHPGIDIAVPSGTPIRAAAAGTVAIAGPESGYGNYTCIDHGGGVSTCYAHQMSISVSVGEHVSQGQVIGISDCTGLCFGPHLHFEVRVNGSPVDPMGYL
ncbi:MAG TPA: peptidoglycan DD-metalloendopeptidase family protein [Solirubrobacterales bacterium]|nr:peptidoglycan DD-metalloendopeptidase family protein [Solirubrobacterales bacterium]